MRAALFLDRDGVININVGHAHKVEQIEFLPGVFDLVRRANELNFAVIIVTNQAGIAKGLYCEDDFQRLMTWMIEEFGRHGALIDHVEFCPHHPEALQERYRMVCKCRKPEPEMIFRAAKKYNLNLNASYIVGDNLTDMCAGTKAGLTHKYLLTSAFGAEVCRDRLPKDVTLISSLDMLSLSTFTGLS
jgi:D-glycero-D-manno-heptose 1,7-bisphosphate phosphatase